ncbi:MAG: response regulator [Gemmatimonadaceae bacterium]|jgi:two-component system cell cycle response regulator CpdR|nr:response regulator [Gemmatimonadaceae bacterium]
MPHALVVDDEPTIRSTLGRFFVREGWEVTACADADEALTLIERPDRPAFDLVLCDARLPGLSGAEFHGVLVQRDPTLAGRLVIITGDPFGAAVSAPNAPLLPVLEKPFEFEALRRLMRQRSGEASS